MALLVRKAWHYPNETMKQTPGAPTLVERLLSVRGLSDPASAGRFLKPTYDSFHDPFLLKDMDKAVDVILKHIRLGSTVFVHGDYDVDGITATATLVSFFRHLKVPVRFYIPDRITDGYGLADAGIDNAIRAKSALAITVDCGISAFAAVARMTECGIETVITDHHECKDRLPEQAAAIVNPKQPGETYPFRNLSGAGVALKLVHALSIRLEQPDQWRAYLDFAALGTLADVMCLTSENRALVSFGIEKIQQQCNIGLNAMLRQINQCNRPITSSLIGFTLAPRLNAAGRMGDASRAVELLLTDDADLADRLAAALNEDNQRRRDLENEILTIASAQINATFDFSSRHVVFVYGDGWHQGVIGIVASRLAEAFCRPAVVLAGESGQYRGSSRSFGDFDMLGAITNAAEHALSFGGHRKACGMLVEEGQIEAFRDKINEFAEQHLDPGRSRHSLEADLKLDGSMISEQNAWDLSVLAPFGEGNREPMFVTENMIVKDMWMLGNGNHMKLMLLNPSTGQPVPAIGFGMSRFDGLVGPGDSVDVAYAMTINHWNGKASLQLRLRDIHLSECPEWGEIDPALAELDRICSTQNEPLLDAAERLGKSPDDLIPCKAQYTAVYQYLQANYAEDPLLCDLNLLARKIARSYQVTLNWFMLSRVLEVFHEAGLIRQQILDVERRHITILPVAGKTCLSSFATYRYLKAAKECSQ